MKISGFTLVRNGVKFDYPFLESLRSLLPLVDELVINVGIGDIDGDETLKRVQEFAQNAPSGKVTWFESHWPLDDPEKKRGGLILSEQTNLALDRCTGDWCIYLQADEVLHEADQARTLNAIQEADALGLDAVVFEYLHFYGSFDVVQLTRSAYRREVRAIRRASQARSIGDAQSFRGPEGKKLSALLGKGIRVFHYGWVRTPEAMREKTVFMDQLYHAGGEGTGDNYRYKKFWGLYDYTGGHPAVMKDRITQKGWHWDLTKSPFEWRISDAKKVVLDLFEQATGFRLFEYRSYRLK